MKQQFNSVFSLLSRDYAARIVGRRAVPIMDIFRESRVPKIVESAITVAERNLPDGKTLRPDARHFLFVNLIEMVVAPLIISNDRFLSGQGEPSLIELAEDVEHDTGVITTAAAEMTEAMQVSSNSIVRALARSLDRLRLNRFEVWG